MMGGEEEQPREDMEMNDVLFDAEEEEEASISEDQEEEGPSAKNTSKQPEPGYDRRALHWNTFHTKNTEKKYCYCGLDRTLEELNLQCTSCHNWFHAKCVSIPLGHVVPFILNYKFQCGWCTTQPNGEEYFERTTASWRDMIVTAIANLTLEHSKLNTPKDYFNKAEHIVPFLEHHWSCLGQGRQKTATWWATAGSCLYTSSDLFVPEPNKPRSGGGAFKLTVEDLLDLRPATESRKKSMDPSDRKRVHEQPLGMDINLSKRTSRTEKGLKRFPNDGMMVNQSKFIASQIEHPVNKDGFRYLAAERDLFFTNACREKEVQAGIYLSREDRSPHIQLSGDRLTAFTEKGLRMARASHCVSQGSWYFEVIFHSTEWTNAHCRIGWSRREATLLAPVGFDSFGYAYRDVTGEKVHESHPTTYGEPFGPGDVIGVSIHLLDKKNPVSFAKRRDRYVLVYRNNLLFEEREEFNDHPPLEMGSSISFYKNGVHQGVAFENIKEGPYYPSISLYCGAELTVNFGPKFLFPPPPDTISFQPMSDRFFEASVETTCADLVDSLEYEAFDHELYLQQHNKS